MIAIRLAERGKLRENNYMALSLKQQVDSLKLINTQY
jgi:hypothetical protein